MSFTTFYKKWFYVGSHARILLRHMTLRRAWNLFINQCEFLLRRETLVSYPGFLKIDPSNRCQLRCPGCGQASDEFRAALPKKGFLTLEEFKRIVDPWAATTLGISLDALGEPLLNKDVVGMMEYAHSLNIGTTIATNLSFAPQEEYLRRIVKSGLDKMMISLDGITSESYEQYRVKGNFDWVRANVEILARLKRELRSKTPKLLWKFIVFDHNRHEVAQVPALYKKWGFDDYRIDIDRADEGVVSAHKSMFARKKSCFWLYSTMRLDADGKVNPCCSFVDTNWKLGNVLRTDIQQLWNSEPYRKMRRGFRRKDYGESMHPVCRTCFGGPKLVTIGHEELSSSPQELVTIRADERPSTR
jgi:radical SAM protein with 4Fe4S-binding SPASM domain